jgi:hypothetical protein
MGQPSVGRHGVHQPCGPCPLASPAVSAATAALPARLDGASPRPASAEPRGATRGGAPCADTTHRASSWRPKTPGHRGPVKSAPPGTSWVQAPCLAGVVARRSRTRAVVTRVSWARGSRAWAWRTGPAPGRRGSPHGPPSVPCHQRAGQAMCGQTWRTPTCAHRFTKGPSRAGGQPGCRQRRFEPSRKAQRRRDTGVLWAQPLTWPPRIHTPTCSHARRMVAWRFTKKPSGGRGDDWVVSLSGNCCPLS